MSLFDRFAIKSLRVASNSQILAFEGLQLEQCSTAAACIP